MSQPTDYPRLPHRPNCPCVFCLFCTSAREPQSSLDLKAPEPLPPELAREIDALLSAFQQACNVVDRLGASDDSTSHPAVERLVALRAELRALMLRPVLASCPETSPENKT